MIMYAGVDLACGMDCELGCVDWLCARSLRYGYHPHEIDAMMREIVTQRNEKALWDKRHMQHVVRIDPAEKLLDASGFMDLLREDAYDYRNEEDSAGKLQRAFWPLHTQDISESLLSANLCVIFDNTFNTSAYDLKLGVFSVVDKNGTTRLLACYVSRPRTFRYGTERTH